LESREEVSPGVGFISMPTMTIARTSHLLWS
jgi:hypothetical protein